MRCAVCLVADDLMFGKDRTFEVPDITRVQEFYREPPAVQRHYMVIRDAMNAGDTYTVGDRQIRLLRAGFEIPITVKQCEKLLRKYTDDPEPSK